MGKNFLEQNEQTKQNQKKIFDKINVDQNQTVKIIVAHTSQLKIIEKFQPIIENIDGVITRQKNLYFALPTGDCIPLIIYDSKKEILAFLHVGWRGVVGKITTKAVKAMTKQFGCNPTELLAYLGPAIDKECYQQKGWPIFIKMMLFIISGNTKFATLLNGKISFDIKGATKKQLIKQGVPAGQIEVSSYCTNCQPELLSSHFREGSVRKSSILTVVGMKG